MDFNVINIDFITRRKEPITCAKGKPYGKIIDPAKSVDLLARVYPSIVGNLDRNQFAVACKLTGQALPGFENAAYFVNCHAQPLFISIF